MLTLQHLQVKLLAEPWDCGMYQVGTFPNWDVWGEWNGKFRDDFRYCDPALRRSAGVTPMLSAHAVFLVTLGRSRSIRGGRFLPSPLTPSPCTATLQALHQG